MLDCENTITYKKVNADEIINVGDVVMIDPENGYITKAVINNNCMCINARMVVGICVWSNNYVKPTIIFDGGTSKDEDRILCESKSDDIDIILIDGGTSAQNQREIIKVAYTGSWPVNVCGYVDLGDRLCISKYPGKAKAIDYTDIEYFNERSIGKVIKYMKNKEQVKVLLDIE